MNLFDLYKSTRLSPIISKMGKLKYLFSSAMKLAFRVGLRCPSCGSGSREIIDRKYIFTQLCRCLNCKLLYRTPTTAPQEFNQYYQSGYNQGFTTDLPSEVQLRKYLAEEFRYTEKDYKDYLLLLSAIGIQESAQIFDFGCSWGYGTWQFVNSGYYAIGYEISKSRADFAINKLGLVVYTSVDELNEQRELRESFDIFFSAHVLEHVDSTQDVFSLAYDMLKPGGYLISVTPNGSKARKQVDFHGWHQHWGYKHPNFIDDEYINTYFGAITRFIASSPYNGEVIKLLNSFDSRNIIHNLNGSELLFIARKDTYLKNNWSG